MVRSQDDRVLIEGATQYLGVLDTPSFLEHRSNLEVVELAKALDERSRDVLVGRQPQGHATVSYTRSCSTASAANINAAWTASAVSAG